MTVPDRVLVKIGARRQRVRLERLREKMRINRIDNMVASLKKLEDRTKALVTCKNENLFELDTENILH